MNSDDLYDTNNDMLAADIYSNILELQYIEDDHRR